MAYLLKVPPLIRLYYGDVTWDMPAQERSVYLTFDDGPHPGETIFVLDQLEKFNAKGTFFCIGKNVIEHPGIYQEIKRNGHTIGNHTFNHINGWKTSNENYYADIEKASGVIESRLFRPPYGKISRRQANELKQRGWNTIMWSVISADFDNKISPQKCFDNVMKYAKPGAIVVFHDSAKASVNMRYALPRVLEVLSGEGYSFHSFE